MQSRGRLPAEPPILYACSERIVHLAGVKILCYGNKIVRQAADLPFLCGRIRRCFVVNDHGCGFPSYCRKSCSTRIVFPCIIPSIFGIESPLSESASALWRFCRQGDKHGLLILGQLTYAQALASGIFQSAPHIQLDLWRLRLFHGLNVKRHGIIVSVK